MFTKKIKELSYRRDTQYNLKDFYIIPSDYQLFSVYVLLYVMINKQVTKGNLIHSSLVIYSRRSMITQNSLTFFSIN